MNRFQNASCKNAVAIVAALFALLLAAQSSHAVTLASAGFNDQSGINSNATPNSPYAIGGLIAGQGAGEPGWAGTWFGGGGVNIVQNSIVQEGDGAARLVAQTGTGRTMQNVQIGQFAIEHYFQFEPGAQLVIYVDQSAPEGEGFQGPVMYFRPNGNITVLDGNEEITGFTWVPQQWYKIGVEIDVVTQTWELFVNDVPYIAPDPLNFRGSPLFLNRIRYQSEGVGAAFLDNVTVLPEPSSILLVAAAIPLVGLHRVLRKKRGPRAA